jgi:hypothetical protein
MADNDEYRVDNEGILKKVIRFLLDGHERLGANLLLACKVHITPETVTDYDDDYDSYKEIIVGYSINIEAPRRAFDVLDDDSHAITQSIKKAFRAFLGKSNSYLIHPTVSEFGSDWVSEALEEIRRNEGAHNQAVEEWSSKIVTWEWLRFRSQTEVRIAIALDQAGVLFMPNCRGRIGPKSNRRSEEADFLVYHNGKLGVLEVDGPYHVAAKDHDKDELFLHHGVSVVRRYTAKECYENPEDVVKRFLELLSKR